MHLVIFGASGRTGAHLVRAALAAGHDVTAFVRTPGRLALEHHRLSINHGDVLDARAVERAVAGADAVLCALGPTKNGPAAVCAPGTANILAAMGKHGLRRIICVTGAMIGHDGERLGVALRVMRWLYARLARADYLDRRRQEELIMKSDAEFTIVRPARLTEGGVALGYQVGSDIFVGLRGAACRRRPFHVGSAGETHLLSRSGRHHLDAVTLLAVTALVTVA